MQRISLALRDGSAFGPSWTTRSKEPTTMCLILDITRNFVLDKGKGRDERRAFPIQRFAKRMPPLRGVQVAADECEIDEVADADGQRDDANGRGSPGVGLTLDLRDEAEGDDKANRATSQQDARAT